MGIKAQSNGRLIGWKRNRSDTGLKVTGLRGVPQDWRAKRVRKD